MHFVTLALGVLGLSAPLTARPTASANVEVFENLRYVPEGWTQGSAPSAGTLMKFQIAVRQARAAEFEQKVIDMSTPNHPDYGKHMARHEMKAFLRPDPDVSNAILSWLADEQVPNDKIVDNGDYISFIVPVSQAERMLDAHFYNFHHKSTDVTVVRTLQYSLPTALHDAVQMIQPTTRFGTFRPQRMTVLYEEDAPSLDTYRSASSAYDPVFCNTTITPECLRGLYGLGNFTVDPENSVTIGISGYLEQLGRYSDLELFRAQFAPEITNNFTVVSVNGGPTDQASADDSVEANLDVQYALALGANSPASYIITGGRGELVPDLDQPTQDDNFNEPYLEQLQYLRDLPDEELPKVLTTSYGENEQSVPEPYTNATCQLFAQLGARGVSIIFSSGDTGVGSACQTNDGKNTTRFLPIFPAACPFVTSVGGTTGVEPEAAVYFSSGGFSDRFPRPSYQDAAVSAYLEKLGDRWQGLYNPEGRGFPDVAAQGTRFSVYDKGRLIAVGGTSASAPTIAGIVASLNSIRLSNGGKPLGFLNPWIYSTAYEGLTDIVDGGSTGCTGRDIYSGLPTPFVPYASWNATEGWDPVTGYGTPIFPKLVELLPPSGY